MSSLPGRASGFTLVEVLVSLALMSLIGTILIESLHIGGHTWQQVTRRAASLDEVARAQLFLREKLGTLYPVQFSPAVGSIPDGFVGEDDAIEFSSLTDWQGKEQVVRYWLGLSKSHSGDIELRYYPERNDSGLAMPASAWAAERLIGQVAGLSIRFWEVSDSDEGQWVDHWENNTRLPRLIRIDVRFNESDGRRWPPLYVEPRLNARASCVFDIVSRRCRDAV